MARRLFEVTGDTAMKMQILADADAVAHEAAKIIAAEARGGGGAWPVHHSGPRRPCAVADAAGSCDGGIKEVSGGAVTSERSDTGRPIPPARPGRARPASASRPGTP